MLLTVVVIASWCAVLHITLSLRHLTVILPGHTYNLYLSFRRLIFISVVWPEWYICYIVFGSPHVAALSCTTQYFLHTIMRDYFERKKNQDTNFIITKAVAKLRITLCEKSGQY